MEGVGLLFCADGNLLWGAIGPISSVRMTVMSVREMVLTKTSCCRHGTASSFPISISLSILADHVSLPSS